jgi:hypothetical protein
MKLIKPLFLDELWDEFHAAGENQNKLRVLHGKISKLRFLDPACGCGNFLITSYRELRLLELAIVEKLLKGQMVTNINQYFLVDLDQFYGIELGEFPSQIAGVAMFLIDHQCNMMVSDRFGEYIPLIPLQKSAIIVNENALRLDWQSVIKPLEGELESPSYHYILGNPPFVGAKVMSSSQKEDMNFALESINNGGLLDYVTGWYLKAVRYLDLHSKTKFAFVSTNSIVQGEQVSVLWSEILNNHNLHIGFAHRTFQWSNEAKGMAKVHCIIVGIQKQEPKSAQLFLYDSPKGEPEIQNVSRINAYLTEGPNYFIHNRNNSICDAPKIGIGNKPIDGGHLLFTTSEKEEFVQKEPLSEKWFRKWIGAEEFINGYYRWCLWVGECPPNELKKMPTVLDRLDLVRQTRLASKSEPTRKIAATPSRFHVEFIPSSPYLVIPEVSSERRKYIPIGFIEPQILSSNRLRLIAHAKMYHFGILHSKMHMTWVNYTCGRLESRYVYSVNLVYNNYPWPESTTDKQIKSVEDAAQDVLDARAQFPDSSLADLYDPNTMPPILVKAHQILDKAVDQCYRPQPFTSEAKRIEFLFELYEKYTGGMFVAEKPKKVKKIKSDL